VTFRTLAVLALALATIGCNRRVLGVDDPGRGDAGADVAPDAGDDARRDLASADAPDVTTTGTTPDATDARDAAPDAVSVAPDAATDERAPDGAADACVPLALPKPIVHYTFDDCSDDLTVKLKDSASDGPPDGARGAGTRCVLGRAGHALYFDGQVGAEVTIPVRPSFTITRVTVAAWVRPSHASDTMIVGRWFTRDQWGLGLDSVEQKYWFSIAVPSATAEWGDSFRVGMAAEDETWTHVAATFDGTTLRIYRNGTLAGEQAIDAPPRDLQDTTKPLAMGYVPKDPVATTEPRFRGDLDDVRVYAVALTPAQIAQVAKVTCGP
jgi:ketosteroid isomerase-like protein